MSKPPTWNVDHDAGYDIMSEDVQVCQILCT